MSNYNYSNESFSCKKVTLLLIKETDYYEPIYLFEDLKKSIKLTKLLSMSIISNNVKNIIQISQTLINNNCKNLPSLPNIYKFSKNLEANRVNNILISKKYEIIEQILNFNGKIIGLVINKDKLTGFIPVYPSNMIDEIPTKFMNEVKWIDYLNTISLLNKVYEDSSNRIKVQPKLKVIEDKLIIGILTIGNQLLLLIHRLRIFMEMI